MTTATKPGRKAKPVTRVVDVLARPTAELPGVIRLAVGRDVDLYFVRPLAADCGRGFRLNKFNVAESYDVLLGGEGGHHSCECKGFLYRGRCKHVDALLVLTKRGSL